MYKCMHAHMHSCMCCSCFIMCVDVDTLCHIEVRGDSLSVVSHPPKLFDTVLSPLHKPLSDILFFHLRSSHRTALGSQMPGLLCLALVWFLDVNTQVFNLVGQVPVPTGASLNPVMPVLFVNVYVCIFSQSCSSVYKY